MRPIVSLGDALRVCADLRPADESARQALRDLLGVEAELDTTAHASVGAWMPSSSHNVMTSQRKATLEKDRPEMSPPKEKVIRSETSSSSSSSTSRTGGRSTLSRMAQGKGQLAAPAWLAEVPALEAADGPDADPPSPPLFDRVRRRGILSSALATLVEEGEFDMERIISALSSGQALASLPRLPLPTLRQGVQLLLDVGQGMDPFAEDQRGLVKALDDVLADVRLEVLRFSGCPTRGVQGEGESRYRPWQPPSRGVPLLVATDLGIGGPMLDRERPTTSEWLSFARRVREEGHLLVGCVPYEATRWPRRLIRAMTMIHWSERTTVGAVRRALRDARGRSDR